ncbi:MAG: DNA polymerase IV [Patescibacteria group bacterium]|nr:DNA polymerase IV [Patescibacteria group bacterium]MDE1966031.1 DNA polymerase IV [Patescibacteria group bacterium]
MWGHARDYPRAILHIDGDAFFAACEVAKNPKLRGKPVVTGKERGIVSAATYEAKAKGVMRGVPLKDVLTLCPDAVILPSDYETYSLYSRRMYEIVRRATPDVEEYGIDECFADITGMRRLHHGSYEDIAQRIKETLHRELDITFSIGLSATKTLAKLGSKWKKPDGFTAIPLSEAHAFLAKTPTERVWGIGPNTAAYLGKYGIRTALDFTRRGEAWIAANTHKPVREIWRELRGEAVLALTTEGRETYQSIQKTKTFTPDSSDASFVYAQLSKNAENACGKARRWNLAAPKASFFLKTNGFRYRVCELTLPCATNVPQELLSEIGKRFPEVFRRGERYRATGVTLLDLREASAVQPDLFTAPESRDAFAKVYERVDALAARYGKHAVYLASSFRAMTEPAHRSARGDSPERAKNLLRGETRRKRIDIPYLGEVS